MMKSTEPQNSAADPAHDDAASGAVLSRRTWHLTLAYDGTDFHGWQIQPGIRTVQGELQDRLQRLFSMPDLRTAGTSRTDAGVHALDQHVSFECATPAAFDGDRLRHVLNRWLPADVRIAEAEQADVSFSARFDSVGKAYTYCIFRGEKPHPFVSRYVWHLPRQLDPAAMREAAARMIGEHDFASFAVNPRRDIDSTVRQVSDISIVNDREFIFVTVVGRSFLYKMVRGMVGYLVHIGVGKAHPAETSRVLAARNRCSAADSAPAQGLFLMKVFFSADDMAGYRPSLPPFQCESSRGDRAVWS